MESLTCSECTYCIGFCSKFCMLHQVPVDAETPYCNHFTAPVVFHGSEDTGERRRASDSRACNG